MSSTISAAARAVEVGPLTASGIAVEWADSPTPYERVGLAAVRLSTRLDQLGVALAVAGAIQLWLQSTPGAS